MSTAMSFSGSQLAAKTAAGRARRTVEPHSTTALLMSAGSTTCRSYHSQGLTRHYMPRYAAGCLEISWNLKLLLKIWNSVDAAGEFYN